MKQIALRDLRVKISSNSNDELGQLGQSFDHMTEQMNQMLVSTLHIAENLTTLSNASELESQLTAAAGLEMVRAMNEISLGAEQQDEQAELSVMGINKLELDIMEIRRITEWMRQLSAETTKNTNQGVNAAASQQQSAFRRIADQAKEFNALALQLFTEIRRFQVN